MPLIKPNSNYSFLTIIIITALFIAGSAAYFSIFGISKVFVGASTAVIIMAISLEVGKLVSISFLYQYWRKTDSFLKSYMIIAIIFLMVITSAGIYGFLSSAHQNTANILDNIDNKIANIEAKKVLLDQTKSTYETQLELKTNRITTLVTLRNNQENRLDGLYANNQITSAKRTEQLIRESDITISNINAEISNINDKLLIINDSINQLNYAIAAEKNNEIMGDIGPLKYVAKITNIPIDKVINYFILLIILVFDPLAISLILAANRIVFIQNNTENINLKSKQKKISFSAIKEKYLNNFHINQ